MSQEDVVTAGRVMILFSTAGCFVLLAWRARVWKDWSLGQKLVFLTTVFFLITLAWDTTIYIIEGHVFSARMIPYTLGIVCLLVYLTEPSRSYRKRLGWDPFEKDKDQ